MSVSSEIRNLTGDVVASFGAGIGEVGGLIEKGIDILAGHGRVDEAVRESLRESLASVTSLRRRDFDGFTERVLDFQCRRESQIKMFIKGFLARQGDLAARLRRSLHAGILQEVERITRELQKTIETAKAEIVSFQNEQDLIRETFASLEAKKETLSVREFKRVIQDLETQLQISEPSAIDLQRSAVG
ncbi:MAG: hypothetical protein HYT87_10985 [Nitrospirae bacterium]|nr:hypothetical protein [Nitrospirota bacterium]